jgi:hypothetical protein
MYTGSSDAWKKFQTYLRPLVEAFSVTAGTAATPEPPSKPGLNIQISTRKVAGDPDAVQHVV